MAMSTARSKRPGGAVVPVLLAAAGLAVTSAVVAAWLIGDQTELPDELDLDYYLTPVELDPALENVVGIASTLVTVTILLGLGYATRQRRIDRRWWSVIVSILAVGAIVGYGWRILTMGVIGFNFGVGFTFFFGVPAVTVLLLFAILRSVYLIRGRHLGR